MWMEKFSVETNFQHRYWTVAGLSVDTVATGKPATYWAEAELGEKSPRARDNIVSAAVSLHTMDAYIT